MKSSGIGGQAVLEGIMMKYKSEYSIAVRKPNGEITVSRGKCKSISEKSVFFQAAYNKRCCCICGVIDAWNEKPYIFCRFL